MPRLVIGPNHHMVVLTVKELIQNILTDHAIITFVSVSQYCNYIVFKCRYARAEFEMHSLTLKVMVVSNMTNDHLHLVQLQILENHFEDFHPVLKLLQRYHICSKINI